MSKPKVVDLTLLKRLVSELESSVNAVESMRTDVNADKNNHELVVEASKAAGLAAGIMSEAGLLVMDIHGVMGEASVPKGGANEFVNKILGSLKGPGGSN